MLDLAVQVLGGGWKCLGALRPPHFTRLCCDGAQGPAVSHSEKCLLRGWALQQGHFYFSRNILLLKIIES